MVSVYEAAMRKEGLLDIIEQLLGPNVKLHHTKLNMKAPGGGAQVEWHTDWGFYPATNDDILEIGLKFDDMEIENGCLMGTSAVLTSGRPWITIKTDISSAQSRNTTSIWKPRFLFESKPAVFRSTTSARCTVRLRTFQIVRAGCC